MKKIERIKDKIIVSLVYMITIIIIFLLASCEGKEKNKENYVDGFHVVVVDSCEYICTTRVHSGYMAHKGNCKYCLERNKKLIREQVDSVLIDIYD